MLQLIFNAIYSLLGWLICIYQVGSAMIVNYNHTLVLVLSVLHLSAGILINIFLCSAIKRKNPDRIKNIKSMSAIGCIIIVVPYFLLLLFALIGWL